jgi:hypothetical protein
VEKKAKLGLRLVRVPQPARRPHQGAAPPDAHRSVRPRSALNRTGEDTDPKPRGTSGPLRDRGVTLLGTVTVAMLSIVGLAWLVAAVGRWWVLVPVMAVALALTAIVLAVMVRLLADDG